jgi:F1F0 ATPase subunit 2
MTWALAMLIGAGLGLVSFGGLWLTVRRLPHPGAKVLVPAGAAVRLGLVGVTFYGLSREGADVVLAGLAGLWLARSALLAVLRTHWAKQREEVKRDGQ